MINNNSRQTSSWLILLKTFVALNGLLCADVPVKKTTVKKLLTHSVTPLI